MTKDELIELAQVGMGIHSPNQPEYIVCEALIKALAQPEQEPDWKGLVLSHNEDCESRCDMDRCGYKPYYEYNGRRCPDCPIHEKIWVEYTPPQRKPLTDEEIEAMWPLRPTDSIIQFARAIEAAHGIGCETTLVKGQA